MSSNSFATPASLLGFAFVSASGLTLARLSTKSPRAYTVLEPSDVVSLAGEIVTVGDAAQRYRPKIVALNSSDREKIVSVTYEAQKVVRGRDTRLLLRYFLTWVDEYHPHWVVHSAYAVYRWAYYGSRKDVEYVQVEIASDGRLSRVWFESSAHLNPKVFAPVHVDAVATVDRKRGVIVRVLKQSRERARVLEVPIPEDERVVMSAVTWNHLLDLGEDSSKSESPEVTWLSERDFVEQSAARRGHPDVTNRQTPGRAACGRMGSWLYTFSPAVWIAAMLTLRTLGRRLA